MTLFKSKYRAESLRLADWDYANPGWYFLTICASQQRDLFGVVQGPKTELSAIGLEVSRQWLSVPTHYADVTLDDFVVMPNHLHAIIVLRNDHPFTPGLKPTVTTAKRTFRSPAAGSLGAIVRSYKAGVSRVCHANGQTGQVWQRNYYEHIIRNDRTLGAIREYMRLNPQNWREEGRRWRATYGDVASYVSTRHWKVLYNL